MPLCIVKQCKNRTISRPIWGKIRAERKHNISFHRFPKDEKLKKLWCDILQLTAESVPIGGRICSAHFIGEAFDISTGMKRLRPNVLPYIVADVAADVNDDAVDEVADAIDNVVDDAVDNVVAVAVDDMFSHSPSVASNSVYSTITTIDRATSPISKSNHLVDRSTNISPNKIFDSPEKKNQRKQLQDTSNIYHRKIKCLQQKIRRKKSRIISLKAILDSLKDGNILGTEEINILQDIGGSNSKIL